MKKAFISMIMVIIYLMLSGCSSTDRTDTVKDGNYIAKNMKVEILPGVTIKNGKLSFYDLINSNMTFGASGTYTIENDILTMTTDDNKNNYVFQIDGDNLVFQKNESSSAKLINDRYGESIPDKTIFYLISE